MYVANTEPSFFRIRMKKEDILKKKIETAKSKTKILMNQGSTKVGSCVGEDLFEFLILV